MAVDAGQARSPRRGPRPRASTTRQAVLEAARAQFAHDGVAATTIRGVAEAAGVDASLVMQFFGSKQKLFAAVMSVSPRTLERFDAVFDGPEDTATPRRSRDVPPHAEQRREHDTQASRPTDRTTPRVSVGLSRARASRGRPPRAARVSWLPRCRVAPASGGGGVRRAGKQVQAGDVAVDVDVAEQEPLQEEARHAADQDLPGRVDVDVGR